MATKPKRFHPRGQGTPQQRAREADARRGSARARGYTAEWDKASAYRLTEHPLCEYCAIGAFGETRDSAADLTDHLFPHRGDRDLFWRTEWWVSCCTACHSGPKQALERLGLAAITALAKRLGRPIRISHG